MATKTAAKPAAKKAAPKQAPAKAPEPAVVESASLTAGDAHAVLELDGKQFHLPGEIVNELRRAFEAVHSIVNPGH